MKNVSKRILCVLLVLTMIIGSNTIYSFKSGAAASNLNLSFSLKNGNDIVFKWNDMGLKGTDSKYRLMDISSGDPKLVKEISKDKTTFTLKNVDTTKNYYFRIDAYMASRTSIVRSNTVKVCFKVSKKNPQIFWCRTEEECISISWDDVSAYGYRVYMKYEDESWKKVKTTKETNYIHKDVHLGTYYFVVVPYTYNKDGKVVTSGVSPSKTTLKSGAKVKIEMRNHYFED